LTAILLLNVTTFLTAFSIVREKERGTLEQLFVTPVRPMGLLLGKLLPYLAIGFSELCLILTFMRFVFQVPIHGNVLLLAFLSLPYLFVSLSIGILVSSKANSQSEAIQLAFLTFLPVSSSPATSSRAKPCPLFSTSSAISFRPAITSTSPAASSCARRPFSSLARWPGPLRHGLHSSSHRRPPLPKQSHHGVSFRPFTGSV